MRAFEGYKKGVDLGGWLSQCGPENYNDAHYSSFISEKDIEKIAGWGLDHVRLPIDYNVLETEEGEFLESGFAYVDRCIEWCKKNGLKLVLDLHKTRGFVFDDAAYCSFFDDAALQEQFISLWEEIARRYAKYHDFVAFELLNEVTEREMAEKWNKIAARTVEAIRKISKDVRIVIGGIFNSSIFGLFLLDKPADENIVFTFHCYSPLVFTHQRAEWVDRMPEGFEIAYPGPVEEYKRESHRIFGADFDDEYESLEKDTLTEEFFVKLFAKAVRLAEDYNVPLYCGEYGVIDYADTKDQIAWYKDINAAFEKYGIPRAAWSYKSMSFGLSDKRLENDIDELIKYL